MSLEAQYLANKLAKGYVRTQWIESNSRLCMASAGTGYKLSLGADGPPGSYDDLDHADVFLVIGANMADCHPILFLRMLDRVKAGAKLIVVDPRRTATADKADLFLQVAPGTDIALLNGLLRLIVEAGGLDDEFVAEHTEGWDELEAMLEDYPADEVARITGHRRDRPAHGGGHARGRGQLGVLLDDGAQPVDARHLEHERPGQPAPGDGRDLPHRLGPVLADRSAQRDGRPGDGLHGPGPAGPAHGARRRRPRVRRGASGTSPRGRCAPTSPAAAPSTCSSAWRRARSRRAGSSAPTRSPRWGTDGTVIEGLERAELVVTQDAFADTETNAYADVVLPGRALVGVRRRDDQLRAQPHARARGPAPAGRRAPGLAAHRAGRDRDGVRRRSTSPRPRRCSTSCAPSRTPARATTCAG